MAEFENVLSSLESRGLSRYNQLAFSEKVVTNRAFQVSGDSVSLTEYRFDPHRGEDLRILRTLRDGQVSHSAAVAQELMVKYADSAPQGAPEALLEKMGLVYDRSFLNGAYHIYRMAPERVEEYQMVLDTLNGKDRLIEGAAPHYLVEAMNFDLPDQIGTIWALSNDDFLQQGLLWGLDSSTDIDINAPEAWAVLSGAPSVEVMVVDSGMQIDHPDLMANFSGKQGDLVTNAGDAGDRNGHGTFVAGVIGGVGNNFIGTVGVAWDVQITPVRVLRDDGGGDIEDTLDGILWACDNGADVINLSVGVSQTAFTPENWQIVVDAFNVAINYADERDVLIVAASGKDGHNIDDDGKALVPAGFSVSYDNVVSVGASTRVDSVLTSSSTGIKSVNLFAPGDEILSTWINYGYAVANGTSTAAPFVSGAAALLIERFGETPAQVIARIENSVDRIPSFAGKASTGGRLNLQRAMSIFSHLPSDGDLPWRESPSFGWLSDEFYPWMFHLEFGWIYSVSADSSKFWFYHSLMEAWLYADETIDSYYRASDDSWLWHLPDSTAPQWWVNLDTGIWETH